MSTKVYGASDDLIEIEGDVRGESSPAYSSGDDEEPALLIFSDGTILSVVYGKPTNGGIWAVNLVRQGALFERIDVCTDEDADHYSDVAHFAGGLKWAYCAQKWELVK